METNGTAQRDNQNSFTLIFEFDYKKCAANVYFYFANLRTLNRMSPGKIAKSQSNGEKTPKARQKKEKAVLKTPSMIKLKIKLPSKKVIHCFHNFN